MNTDVVFDDGNDRQAVGADALDPARSHVVIAALGVGEAERVRGVHFTEAARAGAVCHRPAHSDQQRPSARGARRGGAAVRRLGNAGFPRPRPGQRRETIRCRHLAFMDWWAETSSKGSAACPRR